MAKKDDKNIDCAKELLRCGATYIKNDQIVVPVEPISGMERQLAFLMASQKRTGAHAPASCLCECPLLFKEIALLVPGGRRAAAWWRTKTWRRQILAFFMASHSRVGSCSPVRLLVLQAGENKTDTSFLRLIADLVPKHMSMKDRSARRVRKVAQKMSLRRNNLSRASSANTSI
jgi:hypothetical protein